ncbi:MAG: cytochrome c oxidase subunit I, partial [Solirubrobacteraceae bacterium]
SEILVAFLGFGVWVHHMLTVGFSTLTYLYFTAASLIITIPSAIQIFAWTATIVTGKPRFKTPLLFILGFIVYFIIGGLSGIMVAAIPFDQQVHGGYFIVAHFHFIIFGAAVFPILGGMYFWFPKVTGRMYNEALGKASFWVTLVGTFITFFPMHIVGLLGMPRRQYTYPPHMGWTALNEIETIGSYILGVGLVMIVVNLAYSLRRGPIAPRDPFGGDTLEWSTTSPPPPYNYAVIPTVTSPYAMWDDRDRELDNRRLERGETLGHGHLTPATTVQDAVPDEILSMPPHSIWPPLTGLSMLGIFAMLVMAHYWIAVGFLVVAALTLLGWHNKETGA